MSLRSKNAIVAIAALLSVGTASHVIGQPLSHLAPAELQATESRAAALPASSRAHVILASSQDDDWTAWGGAYQGSPALRHND